MKTAPTIGWAEAPSPRPNAPDQRRHPRKRTLKLGRVSLDDSFVLRCVVRDLSAGGACLITPNTDLVPTEFELAVDAADPRRCGVAWRSGWRLGVAFQF
jgi:PilZ domain